MAPVSVSHDGGLAVVTIDRPARRNAIDMSTALLLASAFDEIEADPEIRATVLRTTGDVFCAGVDLKAIAQGEDRPVLDGRGFAGFTRMPRRVPVVAAVQGPALGGGFELVLACDLVVASTRATFALPEVLRGRIAAGDGLVHLGGAVPPVIANEVVLTGRPIDAARAFEHGLINRVVEPDDLDAVARDLAGAVAAAAPLAVAASRDVLGTVRSQGPAAARAVSDAEARWIVGTADAGEGTRAFLERRAPVWQGA